MTRIVLILTAIPLAAVLALLLNTLLDRRLAAAEASLRRVTGRGFSVALAAALGLIAAPAFAAEPAQDCKSIDCSLIVDAASVDRLWKPAAKDGDRVEVVAQSRIPVAFDLDLDRWDAKRGNVTADEERQPERVDSTVEAPAK